MSFVSNTLGPMLQGVSQQPNRIRVDGQVSEQVNMISDVASGLSSRPATNDKGVLGTLSGLEFANVQFKGTQYIFGYKAGELHVWDTEGTNKPVNYGSASAQAYLGTDLRFHVVDDEIVFTNRTKTVATAAATETRSFHAGIITCLGGAFSRKFSVTLKVAGEADLEVSYSTPDGTSSGDAEKASSEYIITQLHTALAALSLPTGMTLEVAEEVLLIKYSKSMTIVASGGEGGALLRAATDNVDVVANLPRFAAHGTIVKVAGASVTTDDYYLKFHVDGITVDGTGFGQVGTWKETAKPDEVYKLDEATMPHRLVPDAGGFRVQPVEWRPRRVGDSESNPMPSFLGNSVRDINSFEGRLVFVAGPNVVMSRTNRMYDFFRKSATVQVATDPIDIKSTRENTVTLDWIVPFDRNLILISDPGDSQFLIKGGSGLTSTTASMVLTTSFEMFGQARPVTTGRTMIFPFKVGKFSGLKEFFTQDTIANNAADTLTEVQDRYIVGQVDLLASSKNFNMVLCTTNDPTTKGTVYVYKYLWDGSERMQSAWSKWEFAGDIEYLFFVNSEAYFVFAEDGKYRLMQMDLNRPVSEFGYHLSMDRISQQTAQAHSTGETSVQLTYSGATFVSQRLKSVVVPIKTAGNLYVFNEEQVRAGDVLYCGLPFEWLLQPSEPVVKDRNGRVVSSAKITVRDYTVHLEQSGWITAVFKSPYYQQDREFKPHIFTLDGDPLDPTGLQVRSTEVQIPWGERSDMSSLVIKSSDIRPATILELEWRGQRVGGKGRL